MKYRLFCLLASVIWGFAFVAQVAGMDSIGPYTFNGIRFLIGSAVLIPIILCSKGQHNPVKTSIPLSVAILCVGIPLFIGATLQQVALQYTTASKASFLTSTYILMVPLSGLFLGEPLKFNHVIGSLIDISGVYFMSVTEYFTIGYGDLLILLCAVGFTIQIHMLNYFTRRFSPIILSSGQFFVTGIFNLLLASLYETASTENILHAWWPLLYTGIFSTGIAYTLQAVGQKHLPPTEASMILSLEMVFGGISGILFLHEFFTLRQFIGVICMTIGVFLSQIPSRIIAGPTVHKQKRSLL